MHEWLSHKSQVTSKTPLMYKQATGSSQSEWLVRERLYPLSFSCVVLCCVVFVLFLENNEFVERSRRNSVASKRDQICSYTALTTKLKSLSFSFPLSAQIPRRSSSASIHLPPFFFSLSFSFSLITTLTILLQKLNFETWVLMNSSSRVYPIPCLRFHATLLVYFLFWNT